MYTPEKPIGKLLLLRVRQSNVQEPRISMSNIELKVAQDAGAAGDASGKSALTEQRMRMAEMSQEPGSYVLTRTGSK